MKKELLILLLVCLTGFSTDGRERSFRRISWGAEWSWSAVFYEGYHYNYFAPEGYRVDEKEDCFRYVTNGEAFIHAGFNINEFWNISIYAGFSGLSDLHHAVPVSIRLTRYFKPDEQDDRWFGFFDFGSGICLKSPVQEILTGKIGGGYRFSLSRSTKIDFIAALHTRYTHPEIWYCGEEIRHERVNRNDAYISSISLGLALTF